MNNQKLVTKLTDEIMAMLRDRIYYIAYNPAAQEIIREKLSEIISKNLGLQDFKSRPADLDKSDESLSGEVGVAY